MCSPLSTVHATQEGLSRPMSTYKHQCGELRNFESTHATPKLRASTAGGGSFTGRTLTCKADCRASAPLLPSRVVQRRERQQDAPYRATTLEPGGRSKEVDRSFELCDCPV